MRHHHPTLVPIGFCLSMYGMLLVLLQPILHGGAPLVRPSAEATRIVAMANRSAAPIASSSAVQPAAGLAESVACLLGESDIDAFSDAYDDFDSRCGGTVKKIGLNATKSARSVRHDRSSNALPGNGIRHAQGITCFSAARATITGVALKTRP